MMVMGLISVLFTVSFILVMIDRNNLEKSMVPVKAHNEEIIREKLANADVNELKKLGIM